MTIKISTNKILILVICMLLILNLSIFTTMAWMTDTSQVTNTFTVGTVDIELEETDVDKDGKKDLNNYHLIPGEEYVKDPTMTIKAKSEGSYVRMIMTVHGWEAVEEVMVNNDMDSFMEFLVGWNKDIWEVQNDSPTVVTSEDGSKTATFEFRYEGPVSGFDEEGKAADNKLPALFTKLTVPGSLTLEDLAKLETAGFKMVIEGHAIQSAGFIDAKDTNGDVVKPDDAEDAAWAAFEEEDKNEE